MAKKNFEKLLKANTPLNISDIPFSYRLGLLDFLLDYGITNSTFYLRFFRNGFDEWELIGIDECMNRFLSIPRVSQTLNNYVEKDVTGKEIGVKGRLYRLAQKGSTSIFYNCLKKAEKGFCLLFFSYMRDMGMSNPTVIKRFISENWKPWELKGIRNLIEEYENMKCND